MDSDGVATSYHDHNFEVELVVAESVLVALQTYQFTAKDKDVPANRVLRFMDEVEKLVEEIRGDARFRKGVEKRG